MSIYRRLVNHTDKRSLNYRMRQARLRLFLDLISDLPRPVDILDVGGSALYWQNIFFEMDGVNKDDYRITITNMSSRNFVRSSDQDERFEYMVADARSMPQFEDNSFPVVHSNSVIEHVGDFQNQKEMAKELQRIGQHYFVQTPNFWFPVEPHFRAVGWQWLPRDVRVKLVQRKKYGSFPIAKDITEAKEIVDSAQLRTYSEVRKLFPDSRIERERFMGLTKSFVVMG